MTKLFINFSLLAVKRDVQNFAFFFLQREIEKCANFKNVLCFALMWMIGRESM